MYPIILDVEAGQVSAELARRGIPWDTRLHILIEVVQVDELPKTAVAQPGKGFDWLAEEPEFYSDADLVERAQ